MAYPKRDEAKNRNTNSSRIAELVVDIDPEVRRIAITHYNSTTIQQQGAATDVNKRVRRESAKGNLTSAQLIILADDEYDACQWIALRHSNMPASKLASKAKESGMSLDGLCSIALNPSTNTATRNALKAHADPTVKAMAESV